MGQLPKLTVVALTECKLLRISTQAMTKTLGGSPQLAERCAHELSQAASEREEATRGSCMSVHVRVSHVHSLPEDINLAHAQVSQLTFHTSTIQMNLFRAS